jgi:dolichol-phosphate mannosyltransferase
MKYSVVIAAYNEQENIGNLTTRILAVFDAMREADWELIYVIEGADDTLSIAQSFAAARPQIKLLYAAKPSGLGAAFRRGFASVSPDADVVITMDADLNHQPEEMPRLAAALFDRQADIVVGSRKVAGSTIEGAPFWKTALSNGVNVMIRKAIGMPVADQTSGYRVYRMSAFQRISFDDSGFAFLPEILIQANKKKMKIVEEPIQFIFRKAGESKMKLVPTAKSYLRMLSGRLRRH